MKCLRQRGVEAHARMHYVTLKIKSEIWKEKMLKYQRKKIDETELKKQVLHSLILCVWFFWGYSEEMGLSYIAHSHLNFIFWGMT